MRKFRPLLKRTKNTNEPDNPPQTPVLQTDNLNSDDLVVPVYLDKMALFGIWAAITGGFSLGQDVSLRTTMTDSSEKSIRAGADINIPVVRLGGGVSTKGEQTQSNEVLQSLELYQTPESLFQALRLELRNNNALKAPTTDDTWAEVAPSDFVELRGILRPNPVADLFTTLSMVLNVFSPLLEPAVAQQKPQSSSHHGGKRKPDQSNASSETVASITPYKDILQEITNELNQGKTRLFVVELIDDSSYNAIAPLFVEYSRDEMMTEMSHRSFRLLGKVISRISNSKESIDLLRYTKFGQFGSGLLHQIIDALSTPEFTNLFQEDYEKRVKDTTIHAPILEILPIAVYI